MKKLFLVIGLAACLAACGSAPEPVPEQPNTTLGGDCVIPDWYGPHYQDAEYFYARGTSSAEYLEDAEFYAMQEAKGTLADKLRVAFKRVAESKRNEKVKSLGTDVDRGRVSQELTAVEFFGVEPSPEHYKVCRNEKGEFQVFLLGRMPRQQMFESIKQQIRSTELLSKLFSTEIELQELQDSISVDFDKVSQP